MKEVDTEQMIKLRELEVEEKRIVSKRIYIAIWLIISILLISLGIYGFAIRSRNKGIIHRD